MIEALFVPLFVNWRLFSRNLRRHNFIELDFVPEEGELQSERLFLREAA